VNALAVALVAFAACSAAGILGLRLRERLPEHHLENEARDAVKLVMGLVATMSALVLGLLVSAAQTSYRTRGDELALFAANVVSLDRVLLHYGGEAEAPRDLLRQGVVVEFGRIMAAEGVRAEAVAPGIDTNALEPVYQALQRLRPGTDAERQGLARAMDLSVAITRTRMLLVEQQVSALPAAFLGVLVSWLAVLFLGFGLMTRLNPTVVGALLTGALAVAGALFLVLELDTTRFGLIRLSNAPLRAALDVLQRP
jgi:hypothetical protein